MVALISLIGSPVATYNALAQQATATTIQQIGTRADAATFVASNRTTGQTITITGVAGARTITYAP